jgi:hypothetical protein
VAAETPAAEAKPVQRPLIMRYAARSDVGRIRAKNEKKQKKKTKRNNKRKKLTQ